MQNVWLPKAEQLELSDVSSICGLNTKSISTIRFAKIYKIKQTVPLIPRKFRELTYSVDCREIFWEHEDIWINHQHKHNFSLLYCGGAFVVNMCTFSIYSCKLFKNQHSIGKLSDFGKANELRSNDHCMITTFGRIAWHWWYLHFFLGSQICSNVFFMPSTFPRCPCLSTKFSSTMKKFSAALFLKQSNSR